MSGKDYIANYDCHDEYEYMYDDFKSEMLDALGKMKKGKTGEYHCVAEKANWRGSTGTLVTTDKNKLINALLFNDGNCTTRMWWHGCCNKVIEGICYHHDVPTGTKFKIIRQ